MSCKQFLNGLATIRRYYHLYKFESELNADNHSLWQRIKAEKIIIYYYVENER